MNVQEPLEHIVHVNFGSRHDLAATFLRFQEHYESPEFRGRVFTLEEYKQWYTANSSEGKETGEFTYYEDWAGFNIPSEILHPFYQGAFDPLSERENIFLDTFSARRDNGLFYIVGTYGDAELRTLQHEVAHGLFYTRPEYKTAVLAILDEIPTEKERIREFLANSAGYHPSVFDDETHAYILTGLDYLKEEGIDTSDLGDAAQRLAANFRQFSNGLFEAS